MVHPDAQANDDHLLLQAFVHRSSQMAFSTLVERYSGLVYGIALRKCGDPDWAADVTQNVFVSLARKSATLVRDPHFVSVGAWLYGAAILEARCVLRDRIKQRNRQVAMMERLSKSAEGSDHPPDEALADLVPKMDDALGRLPQHDREVIVFRFYDQLGFVEIAARLGVDKEAARKRCSRALAKLARILGGRSAQISSLAVASLLSREFARAAPALLVSRISSTAMACSGTSGATQLITATTAMTITSKNILLGTTALAVLLLSVGGFYHFGRGSIEGKTSSDPDRFLTVSKSAEPVSLKAVATDPSRAGREPVTGDSDAIGSLVIRMRDLCRERDNLLAEAREHMASGAGFAALRPFLLRVEAIDAALCDEAKRLNRDSLEEAIQRLTQLPEDSTRKRSLCALLQRRAAEAPLETVALAKTLGEWAIEAAFRGWGETNPQTALEYQRQIAGGDQKAGRQALLRIFDGWITSVPAAAVEALSHLPYDDQKAALRAFDDHLQSESLRPKLLDAVANARDEAVRVDLAMEFSRTWGRLDPGQASSWLDSINFENRRAVLPAARAIAEGFARSGQPESGANWLWPQLPPEARQEFVRGYVQELWASKDPQAASAWLQSRQIDPSNP